jgi:heat-inducible transcriptional repressor
MSQVRSGVGELSDRQRKVLEAIVTAYVRQAAPIGSATISHVLPTKLSSASIRSTLAELSEMGLVEQPHTSAGRVPTEEGLRFFIDELLHEQEVAEYDRRTIAFGLEEADAAAVSRVAARLLSERTQQLGFVVAPTLDRIVLQHVSLVRLTTERVLAVLVSTTGAAYRRVLDDGELDQAGLDRIATLLNERVRGRNLRDVRDALAREARALRREADRLLAKAIELGKRALSADEDLEADLVIATRLALLDQPEFRDPGRVRDLFEAVETKERLLVVLDQVLAGSGVSVVLGGELEAPILHHCALVATRYGDESSPLGVLGVIGPSRMDYGRVIPLVGYCSQVITEKLGE